MNILCTYLHECKLMLHEYKLILDFLEVICGTLLHVLHRANISFLVAVMPEKQKLNVTSLCKHVSPESQTCMHVSLVSHLSFPVAFMEL